MKKYIVVLVLITFSVIAFGQKLKADGFAVSFNAFEKQEMEMFGKTQVIYVGSIKVKSKDAQKGDYLFYLTMLDGKVYHMTIRSLQNIVLEPRLYYDKKNKSFKYYRSTDKEANDKLKSVKSVKEMVLSGALIWLKIKK